MAKAKSKKIVRQCNSMIEAIYETNYLAKKIMIASVLKCQDDVWAADGCRIEISSNELRDIVGVKRNSLKYLEPAVRKIVENSVTVKNPSNEGEKLLIFAMFTEGLYDRGLLSVNINNRMKPFINDLQKNFTQYHIENIKYLKSEYSMRIFELLKMHAYKGKYRVKIDDLKKMFGIEDKYSEYKNFKSRIIEPAKQELREFCEIYFDYREIKTGNKVTEIEFEIFKQKKDFSDYEEAIAATVKQIDFKEILQEKSSLEIELNKLGWNGDYHELLKEISKEAIQHYINPLKLNLESINTAKIEPPMIHSFIDTSIRSQAERNYELYQIALKSQQTSKKVNTNYSELAKELIKLGFVGDPEKFIEEEGRGIVEKVVMKLKSESLGKGDFGGLIRENVKHQKQLKSILESELKIQNEKKKNEAEEFFDKEEKVRQSKVAAIKKELEYNEKYSKYLREFYEYCRNNSFNDFLKEDFINDFKQKYARKGITNFSDLGEIVKGCFFEWYNSDK